ncbi:GbsR/MarR family transcriptional regulator [Methylocaldum sp. 14B]|jgi:DNA-binding transcriptional regulator GbsR (MarR family)|uniref:GbsR/MarR family transcriptional regulator n=1 Tax=Methylocaldum sp. 14B TaxID=1912213 RepID=UPI000989EC50|nr:GbsR/MarR family transcriptional regulator [Methylocaldum sp. 14B]
MKLTPVMEKYVLHWGEMGSRWGVNRTVAQIHALLYLAGKPLTADEIAETLGVARSNVSTSLKELQSWGLVKLLHVKGDRRDHFEALSDLWDTFFAIAENRKRRELDPTLTVLRECVLDGNEDESGPEVQRRIEAVAKFLERLLSWYDQIRRLPRPALIKLLDLGAKIEKLLGSKS